MTPAESGARSCSLAQILSDKTADLDIRVLAFEHIAGTYFHVALQHHWSIGVLLQKGHIASALALLRPLAEAALRGIWVQSQTEKRKVEKLLKSGLTAEEIVTDLCSLEAYSYGRILEVKKKTWKVLSDFTHTGGRTVCAHFSKDETKSSYCHDAVHEAATSADAWALITANSLALIAGRLDLSLEFVRVAKQLQAS